MTGTSYVIYWMYVCVLLVFVFVYVSECMHACTYACAACTDKYTRYLGRIRTHSQTSKNTPHRLFISRWFSCAPNYTEKMYWQKPKFTRLKIHFNLHLLHRSEYFTLGVCVCVHVNKTKCSQRMKLMAFMSHYLSAVVNFRSFSPLLSLSPCLSLYISFISSSFSPPFLSSFYLYLSIRMDVCLIFFCWSIRRNMRTYSVFSG